MEAELITITIPKWLALYFAFVFLLYAANTTWELLDRIDRGGLF